MVKAITSFYAFLKAMHSEKDGLGRFNQPPSTGWTHVPRDFFPHYTDEVVDLVRHLPYYRDERFFVLPDTNLTIDADPHHLQMLEDARKYEEERQELEKDLDPDVAANQQDPVDSDSADDDGSEPDYPPYIFVLAEGGQYGSSILVDTKHNAIIWWEYGDGCRDIPKNITSKYACDYWLSYSNDLDEKGVDTTDRKNENKSNGFEHKDDDENEGEDEDDESWDGLDDDRRGDAWKTSPAYSPEDFFEMCKEQFRILNWMPVLHDWERGQVIELYRHQEWTGEDLKTMKILRDAGWPGDGEGGEWDKAAAEVAMNRMHLEILEERDADSRGVTKDLPVSEKWKNIVIREGK